jgi:hypothetical protein
LLQGQEAPSNHVKISGFFMNFLIGTMLYSGYLALYFMLLIKFEWREATIARYIKPLGHFISILFPLLLSSVAVAKDYINPMAILPGFCWIWHYPPNCHHDDEVPPGRKLVSLFDWPNVNISFNHHFHCHAHHGFESTPDRATHAALDQRVWKTGSLLHWILLFDHLSHYHVANALRPPLQRLLLLLCGLGQVLYSPTGLFQCFYLSAQKVSRAN